MLVSGVRAPKRLAMAAMAKWRLPNLNAAIQEEIVGVSRVFCKRTFQPAAMITPWANRRRPLAEYETLVAYWPGFRSGSLCKSLHGGQKSGRLQLLE